MPVRLSRLLAAIAGLALLGAASAFAQPADWRDPLAEAAAAEREAAGQPRVELPFSPTFFRLGFSDLGHVLSAPARWDRHDWGKAGLMVLAVGATGVLLDRPVRDAVGGDPNKDYGALSTIENLGERSTTLPLMAGAWLLGAARDDPDTQAAAIDALFAAVIAHGVITTSLKQVAGRARPYQELGPDHFDPFSGDASFPSGHATEAFAVLSVLAAHSDERWFQVTCYALAGTVGYARLRHDMHWTSDVLAGALIGTTVGREVVAYNRGRRAERGTSLALGGNGLELTVRF